MMLKQQLIKDMPVRYKFKPYKLKMSHSKKLKLMKWCEKMMANGIKDKSRNTVSFTTNKWGRVIKGER